MPILRTLLGLCLALFLGAGAWSNEFLDPEEAFKPRVEVLAGRQLVVTWTIADGYKLYRESLGVKAIAPAPALGELVLPAGKQGFDAALGKVVTTYQKSVSGQVSLQSHPQAFEIELTHQGCAEAGLCYPPQTGVYRIDPSVVGVQKVAAALSDTAPATLSAATPATLSATAPAAADDAAIARTVLQGGSLWRVAGSFLLFGLLLSLTPCVLPMIPILSSIIVGQSQEGRQRGFALAIAYSLGMAMVYTVLGVAAGLVGEGLAAFMQHPWVLTVFALVLATFALSMFDVYQLQLPASWQGRMSELSGRFQGGRYFSVFIMGAISSLIVGPCVAAPLAGALLYISQTRDIVIGALALFAMACGMSVPLLLTGLSAGKLLPRAGAWMTHVKSVFGFMLLAVALWMVNPLMGDSIRLLLWGALLVLAAFFTPLLSPRQAAEGFFHRAGRVGGLLILLTGLAEFTGGLMGNADPLAPLKPPAVAGAPGAGPAQQVRFERIAGLPELQAALRDSDRPVFLDFYADWCTSCIEMERLTFRDPTVVAGLQSWRRLQVDVTRNTPQDREIMRQFGIFGPPSMLFFGKGGAEAPELRLIGFLNASGFSAHLNKAASIRGM